MSTNPTHPQSSLGRLEACLDSIQRWQPSVNAMVTTTETAARAEAAAADPQRSRLIEHATSAHATRRAGARLRIGEGDKP